MTASRFRGFLYRKLFTQSSLRPPAITVLLNPIDTRLGSPKDHYVNQVADALMKATGDSIGVADSS